MSDITPEVVAEFLTAGDNEYVEDTGAKAGVYSEGPVVHITVTPKRADRTVDHENARHFRAVVVEGEGPVVIASPAFLAAARALYRVHVLEASSAVSAGQYGSALDGLQTALDALTSEQVAVLAGDDPEAAQAQTGGASDA